MNIGILGCKQIKTRLTERALPKGTPITVGKVAFLMIWLYQPVLMELYVPIAFFGLIQATGAASQIAFMGNYGRLEKAVRALFHI